MYACTVLTAVLESKVTWCVSPWFIVRRKHPKITATDKVLVVHGQQRTGGGQKLWVEDDLERHMITDNSCKEH